MKMIQEFKAFAVRGNVVDMAVGIIIGAAFGKIVSSAVGDIVMPPLGLLFSGVNFVNLFISLNGQHYPTLAAAKEAGAPTLNYGVFLTTLIDFVLVAFVMFLVVRQMNRLKRAPAPVPPSMQECPFCRSQIPLRATRCAHCTSSLPAA